MQRPAGLLHQIGRKFQLLRLHFNIIQDTLSRMAPWDKITDIWKNVQEVDLRPIRDAALQGTTIGVVSASEDLRTQLEARLSTDPTAPPLPPRIHSPILSIHPDQSDQAVEADLSLVLVDPNSADLEEESRQVRKWTGEGRQVIVILVTDRGVEGLVQTPGMGWGRARVLTGQPADEEFMEEALAPAILAQLPDRLLSLGRHFPGLRPAIANHLINDVSFSNAAYAFSTGLAEIVPVLDVPLNIADILVLTKAQALLVYRLGLVLGLPTDWRYYLAEFGSVVGSGFLWRQAARSLVGLIPVVGILPKVAVAYAGTFVVGQVVLRWHRTGRHLTRKEIRQIYREAFGRGKTLARDLIQRVPRPRLRRRKRKTQALPPEADPLLCPACAAPNDRDANFCKNCGEPLVSQNEPTTDEPA